MKSVNRIMKTDQTVERICKIRHGISEECEHDSRKLIEYYIRYQKKHKSRFIDKTGMGGDKSGTRSVA